MTARLMTACFSSSSSAMSSRLAADVPQDAPVHVVQVADDGALAQGGVGSTRNGVCPAFVLAEISPIAQYATPTELATTCRTKGTSLWSRCVRIAELAQFLQ